MRASISKWPRASDIAILAGNLVPVLLVAFGGWGAEEVIFLFWLESIAVGVVALFEIRVCTNGDYQNAKKWLKGYTVPLFILGVFVIVIFIGRSENVDTWRCTSLIFPAFCIAGSHVCSFHLDFLGKGEFRSTTRLRLALRPFVRVLALHFALCLGIGAAWLLQGTFTSWGIDSFVMLVVVLLATKTVLELFFHAHERRVQAAPGARPLAVDQEPNQKTGGKLTLLLSGTLVATLALVLGVIELLVQVVSGQVSVQVGMWTL